MEQENTVQKKSFDFAVKIVKVGYQIQKERRDFDLSRQFIRSGTSIGANIEEALGSSSDKDFLHRVSIAYREARETEYWLRLFYEVGLIDLEVRDELVKDVQEILRLLGAIRKTMKIKIDKKLKTKN